MHIKLTKHENKLFVEHKLLKMPPENGKNEIVGNIDLDSKGLNGNFMFFHH